MILKIILISLLSLIGLAGIGLALLIHTLEHPTLPKVKPGAIRVACVGDSITHGAGVWFHDPKHNSYPALLQALLGDQYQVFNCGFSARTLLKSGDHPYTLSTLYPASQEIQPDIVLIMLGTNDSKPHNWNAAEFEPQLEDFVASYQNLPSHPATYLLTPCAAFRRPGKANIIYDVSDAVIEQEIIPIIGRVAGRKSIPVIDVFSATKDHPEYFGDGVHPNVEGNISIAKTVITKLR